MIFDTNPAEPETTQGKPYRAADISVPKTRDNLRLLVSTLQFDLFWTLSNVLSP
jgi:hypothetical protein